MKASSERMEGSQVGLSVEIEPDEMEKALEQAYRRLVTKAKVPGFRKGKAPRPLLERHLGREALVEDAIDHLLPEAYKYAIQDQGVEVIAQPEVEIIQTEPLIFRATVAVCPEVELGDYHQIRVSAEPVVVTGEQVNSAIERLRYTQAPWEPVARAVRSGDLLTIDVKAAVGDKTLMDEKGRQYRLAPESPALHPDFATQLEGMEKGVEKKFTLPLPPDFPNQEFAGKECLFQVLVHEVKEKRLPELNDEFAKGLGEGFETLDSLRDNVTAQIRVNLEQEQRSKLEQEMIDAVVGLAHLELPTVLVEREVERILKERAQRFGQQSLEGYLKIISKTEEEAKGELRPLAERIITRSLVIAKVSELEKIEVGPEEIDAEVENLIRDAGAQGEEVRRFFTYPAPRQSVQRELLLRKTVERLMQIATSGEGTTKNIP